MVSDAEGAEDGVAFTIIMRGSTLFGELLVSVSVELLDDGRTRLISVVSESYPARLTAQRFGQG